MLWACRANVGCWLRKESRMNANRGIPTHGSRVCIALAWFKVHWMCWGHAADSTYLLWL